MAETIREAYIRRNPTSAALYPRFRDVFSTGVSHDMRVTDSFPLLMARGQGARKWDVDGHAYIDYGLGSASLLLGHAHPAVVEALATWPRTAPILAVSQICYASMSSSACASCRSAVSKPSVHQLYTSASRS